jgi:hypothetical protein
MNGKPKSIWKKSWKGWRALPALVLLLIGAGFLGALVMNILHFDNDRVFGIFFWVDWIIFTIGAAVAFLVLLGLFRFARWIFHWRNFKRFLFGLACFITLIALFYAEEDWRDKHDWEKFKRAEEAKGEKFDWQSIIPPPVPDDENFAFSPVWIAEEKYNFLQQPQRAEAWYGDRIYSQEVSNILSFFPISTTRSNDVVDSPSLGNWTKSTMTDLQPWQNYYRNPSKKDSANEFPIASQLQSPAQDVLFALSKFDPVIEKLRQDSAKPYSRFPLQYDGMPAAILLPHLAAEKRYAQVLQLRAIAELQNDESEKALDDIKLMLRLTDASRTEPFLICHLVRIAILQIALQPIYEGLAEHKWSDAQLVELDKGLSELDFLSDYKLSVRGERG